MNRHLLTVILCMVIGFVSVMAGYGAFVWGFGRGAYKVPTYGVTQVTEPVCGLVLQTSDYAQQPVGELQLLGGW